MTAAKKPPARRTARPARTVRIETVTPAKAKEWLQGNVDNRRLRESRVLYLSRLLTMDEWELTGDAIVFDDQGVLINGQHRLTAVVVANTPAEFLVLRGVPATAQEVMDQGLSRSLGDQLHRRGVKYSNIVAGALGWLYQFSYNEETGNVHYADNSSMRPSLRELLHLYEANTELADEVALSSKLVYYTKVRPGPTLAIHHRLRQIDQKEADVFFENWQEGAGLAKNDAIWRLREWTLQDARTRHTTGRAPTYRYVALAFKAWNFWRDGVPTNRLTFHYSGTRKEQWPTPH